METTVGPLGFTIPVQTLSRSQEVNMTPSDIMAWRNHLPLADLGNSAKKIYYAISDCNKVKLAIKDRFEILELLGNPLQFVCQSLRKHYINQPTSLTEQQITIANLAQALQIEMANGYKLIVEEIVQENLPELKANILPQALQRIIHYFTYIIHRSYQLYSPPPPGIWKELNKVYEYAEKNQLLNKNNLVEAYKQVLLLAATFPYQWRQTEQDTIYNATKIWAPLVTLRQDVPDVSESGFLVIDINEDKPPMSSTRGVIKLSSSCKVLDVTPLINHLEKTLVMIEPNELQARMSHSNDPEFSVAAFILKGIIKEWKTHLTRATERQTCSKPAKIAVGLLATHYFLNNQSSFQSQETNKEKGLATTFSNFSVEETTETTLTNIDLDKLTIDSEESKKSSAYPLHAYTIINEDKDGYGLMWSGTSFPPIQPGEIVAIQKEESNPDAWDIGKVRWLQHHSQNEFRIGIARLSPNAKAGSIQLLKEGKPAGYYLRCLILESSFIVPILPFKSGSQVVVLQGNPAVSSEYELSQLIDSSSSYKQFQFANSHASISATPAKTVAAATTSSTVEPEKERKNDQFDSIWSNL